ncbi:MAG: amidohydrolase/deacetylase family metallohydrolase [Dehalococcoidia bacterium]|nr:amidohydrolase/deacetylase family metallohydrolase [Dehalococcoidia bacterium]
MATRYDLVIKGGEVIDPAQGVHGVLDVAFSGGRVAALDPAIPAAEARHTIDAAGKLVTPGLIDVHGHYFEHVVPWAIGADEACLPNGVTTTVDAGSSGWTHFGAFREFILSKERTRLMALLNLSSLGMLNPLRPGGFGPTIGISGGPGYLLPHETAGELMDLRYAQVEETVQCIRDHPNVLLGVKIRLDHTISGTDNVIPALERARKVADITDTFMMVHVARVPVPMAKVFEYMKPGDIITHVFHSAENNILDAEGNVLPEVLEARDKGIIMDIGAAKPNIGIDISRAAIAQGFLPDTISSDITKPVNDVGYIYNLPDVMSMYLGLGMSVEETITAVTLNPARAIDRESELGTLRVGVVGDATVLDLEQGRFSYDDGDGKVLEAGRRFRPVATVKDGAAWTPREPGE